MSERLPQPPDDWEQPRERWLLTARRPAFGPRSVVLDVTARVLVPTILVFSVYLLVAAHSRPGGGFAGGLVAGMAYVLRYVAGGRHELAAAMPVRPVVLFAAGLLLAVGTAGAPVLFGAEILESAKLAVHLPVFGEVELISTLLFDVGVYAIVLGFVLLVVTALGVRIETEEDEEAREEVP